MALPNLATVEQVGLIMQTDLPADDATALFLLGWASDMIREYVDNTITAVAGDVAYLTPAGGELQLPNLPVTAVTQLERELSDGTWEVVDSTAYRVNLRRGIITPAGYWGAGYWPAGWLPRQDSLRVTYDHGAAVVPTGVAAVAASLAARLYNTPPGVANERNGQRATTYRLEDFLTPMEAVTLGRYREARIS